MGKIKTAIYLVGAYQVAKQFISFGTSYYNLSDTQESLFERDEFKEFRQVPLKQRLNQRYGGEGTWALVTGASDGIGKSFAIQLAKSGYNITLVSRSAEKMQQTVAELTAANPNVKTRIISLDLQTAKTEDYAHLFDAGQHSIVVSNAGVIDRRKFFEIPLDKIENLIKTNVHPYVLLAKYATLHFRENKDAHRHKNALIQTSSSIAEIVAP